MKSIRSWISAGSSSASRSATKKRQKLNVVSTIAVIVCFEVNVLCQAGDYSVANNTAGQKQEEVTDDSVMALLLFLLGAAVLSIAIICITRCASRYIESIPLPEEPKAAAKGKPKKSADNNKDIVDDKEFIGEVSKDGHISIGLKKHFAKLIEDESKNYQLADETERHHLKEADGLSQTFGEQ